VGLRAGADEAAAFLGKLDKVSKVSLRGDADGVATVEVETAKGTDLRASIASAVVQKGWDLVELKAVGLGLEEVFLQLVTQESARGEAPALEEAAL
jgi:hypothetical protein